MKTGMADGASTVVGGHLLKNIEELFELDGPKGETEKRG